MGVECLRGLSKSSRLKPLLQERGWSRVSRFSELVRLGGEADYRGALADVDHAGQAHHALEHLDVVRAAGVAQGGVAGQGAHFVEFRSEEHTSELQSLMRISYSVFC